MRYDDSLIDRILSTISLTEEFESIGTEISRRGHSGSEHTALCPFHDDQTPSLSINEDKGVYYCHSCKAKGNVFTLLQGKKGMQFREAVEYLAGKTGIDTTGYKDFGSSEKAAQRLEERDRLLQMNQLALEYFQSALISTGKALDYLKSRKIEQETIETFKLGYGGDVKTGLSEFLQSKKYSVEEIKKAGLIGQSKSGGVYDVFRGRLVFPILDSKGRIAGFSGRILKEKKGSPKYLNTCETSLFKKNSILYGLYENREVIRDLKLAILVEGFMDVIGLWQSGIKFAVSSMGTSFSEQQARMIQSAGIKTVIILFDGDDAGRKAVEPVLIELSGKAELVVGLLPDGKDPDEIALVQGPIGIDKICNVAENPLSYLAKDSEKAFEFIAREPSKVKQDRLLNQFSEILKVSPEAVKADFMARFREEKDVAAETLEGEFYEGRKEYPLSDSTIVISKDWKMFLRTDKEVKDEETGQKKTEFNWFAIQTTHVLIPKYKVKLDDEMVYTIECRQPKAKPFLISIPEDRFGEPVKLQDAFTRNSIAIQIGKMRQSLHAYCLKYSVLVKPANVGVNYTAEGSFIAGYDYIIKGGQYYPAVENIVKVSDQESYFITGHNLKRLNESKLVKHYSKSDYKPAGKISEFIRYSDKLFRTREKSRITAAFLATAMLREKLLEYFTEVPSLNFYGQTPSVGKTTFLDALSGITNIEKHKARITEHQLYKLQEWRTNGLILIDDMRPVENYVGFLKDAASNSFRTRRDIEGKLNNPQLRNSVFMTTNHSVSLDSEGDSEALESRVINIHFTKEDQIFGFKAYREFRKFIQKNAFDIYIDFYNHISKINMDDLEKRVEQIEEEIVKLNLKSTRIIKLWAILLACGEAMGIEMDIQEYLAFIEQVEGEKLDKSDFLASALLECAVSLEKNSKAPITYTGEAEKNTVKNKLEVRDSSGARIFTPIVLNKSHFIKLSDVSDFFKQTQMMKDHSQENVMKEIYKLPFVRKHKLKSKTQWIDGHKHERVGTYIEIDFANEVYHKSLGISGEYAFQLAPQITSNPGDR